MNDTDNQQVRLYDLYWLAGLFEGEGNISLVQGSGKRIMPRASIINTDFTLIEETSSILTRCGVGHYIQTRANGCSNNPNHATAKVISICGLERVRKFCRIMLPYFRGHKKEVLAVVLDYCEYRLSQPKNSPYTGLEIEWVKKARSLNAKGPKETSETLRQANLSWLEDKVQAA
jgi:hypothetical protein